MTVRLKSIYYKRERRLSLTLGRTYRVLGISIDDYRLLNDKGHPVLYRARLFDVVDPSIPKDWVTTFGEDGERYCDPGWLSEYVWNDYFDDVESAVLEVRTYLESIAPCSWDGDAAPTAQ